MEVDLLIPDNLNHLNMGLKPEPIPAKDHKSVKVLADGKIMKVQKTRQRKILSCVYCHSKKIKCSRAQPICNNCDKLGIECKYFINERVSRGGKKSKSDKSSSPDADKDRLMLVDKLRQGLVLVKRELVSSSLSENRSPSPKPTDSSSTDGSIHAEAAKTPANDGFLKQRDQSGTNTPLSFGTTSLLQTPVMNTLSNNITNNFFNTNYSNSNKEKMGDDQYSFNLSSFTFNTGDNLLNMAPNSPAPNLVKNNSNSNSVTNMTSFFQRGTTQPPTNFLDSFGNSNFSQGGAEDAGSTSPVVLFTEPEAAAGGGGSGTNPPNNNQPNNPGLHNSLNAYTSNPATTVNYLYGTNTYYDNDNLLTDLLNFLPNSRERSYELLNRYVNSVHILLPIMINLTEFVKEHDKYWDHHDHTSSKSSPSSASSNHTDFNYIQFYTLYFPILYASTISEFEEYDNLLLNQDIDKFLRGFNKICQYHNYPHGLKTIPLLLGNVIIQSTSPNPSTMEMSQIIRYAKFLQMHKDPILSLNITDREIVRFRRLLWWVIFGLDALTSHNFCLPPVCRFDDFDVLFPDDEEPVYNESGTLVDKKLDVTMLSMNVKFSYDRVLSDLVYQLHNGLSNNISPEKINEIKQMIVDLFHFIHKSINRMTLFYKSSPPQTVQEMNLINFIKNHSWSFVDRALMLLHKKILLRDTSKDKKDALAIGADTMRSIQDADRPNSSLVSRSKPRGGALSLSQFEDTFGHIEESNIITNFDNLSISQLRFNQYENFTYENLHNNLIPSILHNLNDFLKYNDFIKFGRFNWYVKRTIPLDLIILLFIIICVKFKYEFMTINELVIYVKLINKALFILNRKWFKNEKYKRMLSLTNLTWEYILKKYNIVKRINQYHLLNNKKPNGRIEFFDYQVTGFMNMSELFNVMDVPQPILVSNGVHMGTIKNDSTITELPSDTGGLLDGDFNTMELTSSFNQSIFSSDLLSQEKEENGELSLASQRSELSQLNEKIYYDLRNNFVDINDYCAFYSSLENILHELMEYINKPAR